MGSKTTYCLGFAFSENDRKILLINKQKPEWQKGKLNGLGGKVEVDETPGDAMVREFKEECGLDTLAHEWVLAGIMRGPEFTVYTYTIRTNIGSARALTDEPIYQYFVDELPIERCIVNVPALMYLCKAKLYDPSLDLFTLNYNDH